MEKHRQYVNFQLEELLDFEDENTHIPNDPLFWWRQRKHLSTAFLARECANAERLLSTAGLTLTDK